MKIKLIAIDMDDTLLNSELAISERTFAAVTAAQAKGVAVAIATGRMFSSALPYAKQLAMQVPIITYNGALIRHPQTDATLFHQTIEDEAATKVRQLFKERGWYLQAYVNDQLYVKERGREAKSYEALAGIRSIALGDDFFAQAQAPTKMLAMAEPELLAEIEATVNAALGGRIFTATSKPTYLELMHPDVNKGRALAMLGEHLGVERDEIMAIGDSNNDYAMLEYAGLGVAMGNASERVKKVAQFVTDGNDADGVAQAIEQFILA
ncbi:Cof-type HAD-IIB family hydrolase [Azotosporobacter soli]|uniref:Cof-type HAD-IIB family hydrolase n=1 Tax=Azotosporobacter soli TaxID=3055040 RepID=UPI0031FE9085